LLGPETLLFMGTMAAGSFLMFSLLFDIKLPVVIVVEAVAGGAVVVVVIGIWPLLPGDVEDDEADEDDEDEGFIIKLVE
jgi:hypothetical protein